MKKTLLISLFVLIFIVTITSGVFAVPDIQKKEAPYTVALSNGFIGSEWRVQMVEDAKEIFQDYKDKGLVKGDLYVNHAGADVTGQVAQIRNMINKGYDIIIVNPNSQTALNPVFAEAAQRGTLIITVDQEVTSPNVINVVIDQAEWARISARWLVEQLDQEGKIIALNGISGSPANEARWRGANEIFSRYPDIEILTIADGGWDQATGQQVMSNLLATYSEIDGVWTQDGMAEGALRAILASNNELPEMVGEARVGYMRLWNELKEEQDFESIGVVNPPGGSASAMHIAINFLQGKEFKDGILARDNTLYIPIPEIITNENFDENWEQVNDESDSYVLDGWLSEKEALEYFKSN